jgi:subtilisin family serine protease
VAPGRGVFELIREFSAIEQVAFAEPSEISFDIFEYTPDDPLFRGQYGPHRIEAEPAWDITRGTPNVIIAIVDSGADLNHPDLAANILPRGPEDWNFVFLAGDVPEDANGHGTHVAGIAAAVDNAIGVIGVAPGCRIMPLKIGHGPVVSLAAGADAINYVATKAQADATGRYLINLSWGGTPDSAAVHHAIQRAVGANVVVVAAAGNDNKNIDQNPVYPLYPEVIAVAATCLAKPRTQKCRSQLHAHGISS